MPYQDLLFTAVSAVVEKLKAAAVVIPSGVEHKFNTVAVSEPKQLEITRMPAAFVIIEEDLVTRKTKNLEDHSLRLTVSALQQVATNSYGDTEFINEFSQGVMYAALAYDALVKDRTLGGVVKDLEIIRVDYGRTLLDTQLVFWGDMEVELSLRYVPNTPQQENIIEQVFSKGGIN